MNLLKDKSKMVREERSLPLLQKKDMGLEPAKLFFLTLKVVRVAVAAAGTTIEPLNKFLDKSRVSSLVVLEENTGKWLVRRL